MRPQSSSLFKIQRRTITGVAPTIFIPKVTSKRPYDEQVKRNTEAALELIRAVKGEKPAPYTRKHTQTFEALSREVEGLLGSAAKLRRPIKDNEPLDKLGAMERALRHALWSYMKDEGKYDFEEMEKWLVYTSTDSQRIASLRADVEKNAKYAAFRKKRVEAGQSADQITMPIFDGPKEYDNVVDREVVVEKRLRYNTLQVNTTARDDAVVDAENAAYLKPQQDKRLDHIVDLLERFKPMLGRESILQRLTIKHLEGQLGVWRYLDWNPEVRDRAELEADNWAQQWWMPNEEKRLANVRLRSKNELVEVVERNQARRLAEKPAARVAGGDNAQQQAREKLLAEIVRMQQRIGRKDAEDDDKASSDKAGDKAAATSAAPQEEAVKVSDAVVKEKGVLGLDFITASQEGAKAQA